MLVSVRFELIVARTVALLVKFVSSVFPCLPSVLEVAVIKVKTNPGCRMQLKIES